MPIPDSLKTLLNENKKTLTSLDLSNRGLDDSDVTVLVEILERNNFVFSIDLERNNISSDGMKPLSSLLHRLTKLNLRQNRIDDKGIKYLLNNSNSKLESLDVSLNALTNESGSFLLDKMSVKNASLKYVTASGNEKLDETIIRKLMGININEAKKEEREPSGPIIDIDLRPNASLSLSSNKITVIR